MNREFPRGNPADGDPGDAKPAGPDRTKATPPTDEDVRKLLPELSRFELQCLRRLWEHGEASVRAVHEALPDPPSYSTVRKIFERLEEKGAVERVRLDGRAWVYRSRVSPPAMIRKEIRRLVDALFDGSGAPLLAHLVDMDAVSMEDLRHIESQLDGANDEDAGKGGER